MNDILSDRLRKDKWLIVLTSRACVLFGAAFFGLLGVLCGVPGEGPVEVTRW